MVMQPRPMAETSRPLEPSLRFCINGSPSDGSTYHRHYLLGAQLGRPDSVPMLHARSGKVPSRETLPLCKQRLRWAACQTASQRGPRRLNGALTGSDPGLEAATGEGEMA